MLCYNFFTEFESRHGVITGGSIVIIRTDHSRRYLEGSLSYLGYDEAVDGPYSPKKTTLAFPGLLESAALLLVERSVSAVGLDTASLDVGSSLDFIAHRVLLGSNIYGIENLSQNIDKLPTDRPFTLMVFPMKVILFSRIILSIFFDRSYCCHIATIDRRRQRRTR